MTRTPGSGDAEVAEDVVDAVDAVVVEVGDPGDPRLRDFTDLTDVELRRRREPAEGMFLAEGEKVIRRAVAAGYPMRSMLLSRRWLARMAPLAAAARAPVYLADERLLERITGFRVHRGALAAMSRKPLPDVESLLAGEQARRVAVLEDIVDHTNVGAVFRGAAALGVDAVLVTPRCADPLYRRSVKVSMGTVFQVPWTRLPSWPAGMDTLRQAGFVTAALTPADDALSLEELAARHESRLALVLGTEGDGLSQRTVARADLRVRIPMAGGVDSLNVAAAAAVAFYVTRPASS